ncbi:hypothetical protein BDV93DRAFT_553648 [Ceratobasidium sp. AG-I]|nr:hypothetical protein BDV93DRAFT_553648 [Ceratobasidium sp. AG-I]
MSGPLSTWALVLVFGSSALIKFHVWDDLTPRDASIIRLFSGERVTILGEDRSPLINGTDFIQSYLASARSVRELDTTYFLLDQYLPGLGELPQLEILRVDVDILYVTNLPLADLPEDAFPALRTVSFTDIRLGQATTIWQAVHLVDGLTTIGLELKCHDLDLFPQLEKVTSASYRLLSANSPHITRLKFDFFFACEDQYGGPLVHKFEKDVLAVLSHLPLQELSLSAACCEHPDTSSLLMTNFPRIRILQLPDQPAQCQDLALFMNNPNLVHLSLHTNFEGILNPERFRGEQYQPQRGFLTLDIDSPKLECAQVPPFIMYILAMWPNVKLSPLSHLGSYSIDWLRINQRRINVLNTYLQSLRTMTPDGPIDLEDASRLWEHMSPLW